MKPGKKNITIMGFGTFDGLHPGHIAFLEQLRALGGRVVMVIARDVNAEKTKGKKPHFNERERLQALQKTGLADEVILGDEHDFYKCLADLQPDVIGLGYDQRADLETLQTRFSQIKVVRLKAFQPEKYKSSLLNG